MGAKYIILPPIRRGSQGEGQCTGIVRPPLLDPKGGGAGATRPPLLDPKGGGAGATRPSLLGANYLKSTKLA